MWEGALKTSPLKIYEVQQYNIGMIFKVNNLTQAITNTYLQILN